MSGARLGQLTALTGSRSSCTRPPLLPSAATRGDRGRQGGANVSLSHRLRWRRCVMAAVPDSFLRWLRRGARAAPLTEGDRMVDPGVSWPAEKEAWPGTGRIGIPRRDARSGTARGAPRRMAGSVWVAAPPQWGRPPAAGRRASNRWPAPTEGVAPISRRKPRGRYKFLQCKSLHAETGDASNLVRWTIGTPPIRRGHPVLSATQGPCGHC